ncbi:MAG: DMT family transporter [Chryseobacterium sp.]|nr:MAG: DMT family transporter [Chryseobacterium sp.]
MLKSAQFRLHLIVFLWGFTAILGKLITLEALQLVWFRMLFASLFLYVVIRFVKGRSVEVDRKLLLKLFGIGCVMALHWLCFFYSIKVSNVSIALSCLSTSTLFAAIIEPLVFRRKVDWTEIVMGIVIVACILAIFRAEFRYVEGIVFGILCALLGAIFQVFNGKLYGSTASGNIILYEIFGGWLLITAFMIGTGQIGEVTSVSAGNFGLVLVLASLFTAYPMFESIRLMKYISPFTLVLTVNLEPVYGIILAFFIFGQSEHMSPVFYVASFVMILSIVANGILKARKNKRNAQLTQ